MLEYLAILTDFRAFLLIAFRISGLALMAPFFSSPTIPPKIKVGLTFALAAVIMPTVSTAGLAVPDNMMGYFAAILAEIAIGAIIGLVATLAFAAIQLGGFIAAQQIGLAISQVYDPSLNQQTSIISQIYFYFALVVFLMVNGHHVLLRTIAASFDIVPLAGFTPAKAMGGEIGVTMAGRMFVTAIQISAPAVIALMMTTIVMAIVARTVPEMNIFNIGFAVRLGVGLGVLVLSVPALAGLFQTVFDNMGENLRIILREMAGSG